MGSRLGFGARKSGDGGNMRFVEEENHISSANPLR